MVAQYQEAGLNPALMYQQGASPAAVDTAGADPEASSGQGGTAFEPMEIVSSILGMLSSAGQAGAGISDAFSQVQRRSVENEVDRQNAATAAYDAETRRLELSNTMLKTSSEIAVNNSLAKLYGSETDVNVEQVKLISKKIEDVDSQIDSRDWHNFLDFMGVQLKSIGLDFEIQKWYDVGRDEALANIAEIWAKKALDDADADLKARQKLHIAKEEIQEDKRQVIAINKLNEQKREFDKNVVIQRAERWHGSLDHLIDGVADVACTMVQKPMTSRTTTHTTRKYDKYGRYAGTDTEVTEKRSRK